MFATGATTVLRLGDRFCLAPQDADLNSIRLTLTDTHNTQQQLGGHSSMDRNEDSMEVVSSQEGQPQQQSQQQQGQSSSPEEVAFPEPPVDVVPGGLMLMLIGPPGAGAFCIGTKQRRY